MGYDKKLLKLRCLPVMRELITTLRGLFGEILVSSNEPFTYEQAVVLPDVLGAGPLAGIYQGLAFCRSEYLYVTACDMPFISRDYITYIKEITLAAEPEGCVACREDGFYEPFNAFFSKRCIPHIYESLIRGEYKIRPLLDKLNLYIVDPAVVKTYTNMFFNINRPEDAEQAEAILRRAPC
jgi:molybdopterin-guanine dinucleotide biosynthesis protein A